MCRPNGVRRGRLRVNPITEISSDMHRISTAGASFQAAPGVAPCPTAVVDVERLHARRSGRHVDMPMCSPSGNWTEPVLLE